MSRHASAPGRAWSVLTALAVGVVLVPASVVAPAAPAGAADLSLFEPGNIISDAIFFDSTTMDAAAIDTFLDGKGAACVAGDMPCLKDYTETTTDRAADSYCAAYSSAPNESAGRIVAKVAVACGINPQVLLVTLQKEQGLVTVTRPGASRYQKAMGYGCPDSSACDTRYYGFFNQVYSAAHQFQRYTKNPTGYNFRAGVVNNIQYHPVVKDGQGNVVLDCGTTPVLIQNQATANLYIYTPYTPNAAALAAGYGSGDQCSSYGNRNFWNYFRDWFGPTTDRTPIGYVDSVSTTDRSITVTGWALDPDTTNPIQVHVYIGGTATAFTADLPRPDLDPVFHKGSLHGFSATVPAPLGTSTVCVYALNDWWKGANPVLACPTATVVNAAPAGDADGFEAVAGVGARVFGWANDPDTRGAAAVRVTVDGVPTPGAASSRRPVTAPAFGDGSYGGFDVTAPASAGSHQVCADVLDSLTSTATSLGCQTLQVPATVAPPGTTPGGVASVSPTRLADVSVEQGFLASRCLPVSGAGVPAGATGVLLNVAAVSPAGEGNAVVFPDDGSGSPPAPTAASVSFEPGQDVANAAFVRVGPNGRVCYAVQSHGPARVVLDVTGYTSGADVVLGAPTRLLDTRPGASQTGPVVGPVPPRTVVEVPVAGRAGVPANAVAVIANVTVVGANAPGNLRAYPADGRATPSDTVTVSYAPGRTKGNSTLVTLGRGGAIALWSDTSAGTAQSPVQVVIDVMGYVSAGSATVHPITPQRALDTRPSAPVAQQLVPPLSPRTATSVRLGGRAGIPSNATAAVVVVTGVGVPARGNLRVYGGSAPLPSGSTLNYIAARNVTNLAVVPLNGQGMVTLYSDQPDSGRTNVVVDVVAYLGPTG